MWEATQLCLSQCGRGLQEDFSRRLPHYVSDWTLSSWTHSSKLLSSSLFTFFSSVAPSITFALYMTHSTHGQLGAVEILLATGLSGCWMSLCAGQPLVIVGVTGPVAILTASIFELSQALEVEFIPFYALAQLWAAAMHVALAATNACDLVSFVTRFSCETFGVLIAIIYIYTGLEGISQFLRNGADVEFASALLQLILALGTVFVAQFLGQARSWTIFNETIRTLISDYAATFAVLFFTVVPYFTGHRLSEPVPTLYLPNSFSTTSGRPWLVDFTNVSVREIFAAIFPGFIITVLFFFDHNVSSIIAQSSDMKLTKGHAFHWDFLALGLSIIGTAILGLPPTNGLIPQAPLHTKSLSEKRRIGDDMRSHKFEVVKVHEQRITNLMQSIMCGIVVVRPFSIALRKIPTAVLYGFFLYLGISSFEDNQFGSRMKLLFVDSYFYQHYDESNPTTSTSTPPNSNVDDEFAFTSHITLKSIGKFTVIQFTACAIIFGVTFTPAGVIFPVLIALLVILRLFVFPKLFSAKELNVLDSDIVAPTNHVELQQDIELVPVDLQEEEDDVYVHQESKND